MKETTVSIRLGRVLYWTGCGIAVAVNLITVPIAIIIFFTARYDALSAASVTLIAGLCIGATAWIIGKVARYTLANEWNGNEQKQMAGLAAPELVNKRFKANVISDLDDEDPAGAEAVMNIQLKCQVGTLFASRMYEPDEDFKDQSARYKRIRDECIALVDQIDDEFYRGAAVHRIIDMCIVAKDLTVARSLLVSVRDNFIREKIFETAPTLRSAERLQEAEARGAGYSGSRDR